MRAALAGEGGALQAALRGAGFLAPAQEARHGPAIAALTALALERKIAGWRCSARIEACLPLRELLARYA